MLQVVPGSVEAVGSSAAVDFEFVHLAGDAEIVVVHEVDDVYDHDEPAPVVLQSGF